MEGDERITPFDGAVAKKAVETESDGPAASPQDAANTVVSVAPGASPAAEGDLAHEISVARGLWHDDAPKLIPPTDALAEVDHALQVAETDAPPEEAVNVPPLLMDIAATVSQRDIGQTLIGLKPPVTPLMSYLSEPAIWSAAMGSSVATAPAMTRELEELMAQVFGELTPHLPLDPLVPVPHETGLSGAAPGATVVESATSAVIYNAAMIPGWPFPSAFAKDDLQAVAAKPVTEISMTAEEMAEYLAQIGARLGSLQRLRERIAEVGAAMRDQAGFIAGFLQALDSVLAGLTACLQLGQQQLALIPVSDGSRKTAHRIKI